MVLTNLSSWVGDMCWKPSSSCWSLYLLREEFLSAPIHSPLSGSLYRSFRERRRRAGRVAVKVRRMRACWIFLARSQIWTTRVTVFNETTGVPLTALCSSWNFMGIIVNIGGKFLAARARFACWRWRVGQCHRWRWWVDTHHLCWELGSASGQRLSFYFGYWRWRVGQPLFSFEWIVLP
jgi:hypothetical protein